MIQHYNGLNIMYAHLSAIDVSKGQTVTVGQTIGLSGMTGYATDRTSTSASTRRKVPKL